MEIEKTLTVSASRERVWALLLDPQVMGGAVPGMQSIEVVSPTEYVAVMHQKISFISARFKLRTRIVEQRAPEYLRVEGTGEDTSVASSLKQRSEIFLSATPDGGTELRIKIDVDLLGRLGAFGLSVMKTKADRIWEEFGNNLAVRLEGGGGGARCGRGDHAGACTCRARAGLRASQGNGGASPEFASTSASFGALLHGPRPAGPWLVGAANRQLER